jgi:hypothetical protein
MGKKSKKKEVKSNKKRIADLEKKVDSLLNLMSENDDQLSQRIAALVRKNGS